VTAEHVPILYEGAARAAREINELAPGASHRTTTYTAEAATGRRAVAAVWALERNPWLRTTIPPHMAKNSHLRLARRPGWARLASDPVLGFVASAGDGAARCFPDMHVVVSLLPEASPRRVRGLLPGGYLRYY
jgi:hypothetical protein